MNFRVRSRYCWLASSSRTSRWRYQCEPSVRMKLYFFKELSLFLDFCKVSSLKTLSRKSKEEEENVKKLFSLLFVLSEEPCRFYQNFIFTSKHFFRKNLRAYHFDIEKNCLINCPNGKNCKDHLMWEQLKTVRLQNRNNGVSTNEADPREILSK